MALAAENHDLLTPRYVDQLGGLPLAQDPSPGFIWAQVEYANGMVVEMLEPDRVDENDFLRRFLDRSGPGPHHLTFKVPNFGTALDAAAAAGYTPVAVNDSDPEWKEAFLHPKEAAGVVVQLAESHEHIDHPDPCTAPSRAHLLHVAHAVQSLDEGTRLFEGLLGGRRIGEGAGASHRWVDFRWPGPGRMRLLAPTGPGPVENWLGSRTGRVHSLAFAVSDPDRFPDAQEDGPRWLVEPDANLGTRLVLVRDPADLGGS